MVLDEDAIERAARAEWEKNSKARAEFLTLEHYLAFAKANARGLVRICGSNRTSMRDGGHAGPSQEQVEREAREQWARDPVVRSEFLSVETFVAFKKAEARGAVRISGKPKGPEAQSPVSTTQTDSLSPEGRAAMDRLITKRNGGRNV